MTTDTEALRAQFEAWFADGYPRAVERDVHGQYKLMAAQSSWVAFQAGHTAAHMDKANLELARQLVDAAADIDAFGAVREAA